MHSIVECQPEKHAYKLKSDWHFVGVAVEPVESAGVFGDEHVEIGVEYLFGDECEVLIFDSSLIGAFLANKLYFERTSQIGLNFAQFLHRIIEDIVPPDSNAKINQPLKTKIARLEIKLMNQGSNSSLHIFLDIHFLLIH